MRILIACGSPGRIEGGVAGVVHSLSTELRTRGHSVDCLFLEDVLSKRRFPARFDSVNIASNIAAYVHARRGKYDVANIHAPYGFAYGMMRKLRGPGYGPPYVMTMHGIEERRIHAMRREARRGRAWYFRWKNRFWHRVFHMPTYRLSIVSADQCVLLNREAWSCVLLKYNREADRVWYVPNGVERRFFLPRRYGEGLGARLLFVGTWIDHKGVLYLVDVFAEVAGKIPEAELTIAGCQLDASAVLGYFPAPLRERVWVMPFVAAAEMPGVYAEHDILLYPSLVEGMPLVLLEAMATGMAVVTTETCGMVDLIEDGVSGLLAPPASTQSLVEGVSLLMHDAALRRRLGTNAQARMEQFTWEKVAAKFERVLALAASGGMRSSNRQES